MKTKLGILAVAFLVLAACAPDYGNTAGPYRASVGRTDCAFSTRFENGGVCPAIPVATLDVAKMPETEKGCGAVDYFSNGLTCPPPDVAPGEEAAGPAPKEIRCYRTLGRSECYEVPAVDPRRTPTADPPSN